jgi:antitoxin ParD1/3/4
MRADRSITVTISDEMREFIDRKIASGEYADESAVVAEGLRLLDDEDMDGEAGLPEFELEGEALKTWLRREVLPVIEAHEADPSRGRSLEETRRALEDYMNTGDRRTLDI